MLLNPWGDQCSFSKTEKTSKDGVAKRYIYSIEKRKVY